MKRYALADCNNFYVSCERIFDPKLIGKPVVILSSNDACVIARSNEAKALGIQMGEPAFKCKDIFKKYNVVVMSSNFTLYGDISNRVMQVLEEYSTDIEIYSVDESFFFLPYFQIEEAYLQYAKFIRKKVKQKVGIPISIGLGPNKTLAKIANKIAKKSIDGVFDITNHSDFDNILKKIEVRDIWGIGFQYSKKLNNNRIFNAYELKNADQKWVRKNLTINGLRTVQELNGISCIQLTTSFEPKDNICVSRSFGKNITDKNEIKEALANHAVTAARKLRFQNSVSKHILIFLCYQNYQDNFRYYCQSSFELPHATSYTPELIKAASLCLDNLFISGRIYKKCGIILSDIIPANFIQLNTLEKLPSNIQEKNKIIKAIDNINNRFGKNKATFAAAYGKKEWLAKSYNRSQNYTTSWHELLMIKI